MSVTFYHLPSLPAVDQPPPPAWAVGADESSCHHLLPEAPSCWGPGAALPPSSSFFGTGCEVLGLDRASTKAPPGGRLSSQLGTESIPLCVRGSPGVGGLPPFLCGNLCLQTAEHTLARSPGHPGSLSVEGRSSSMGPGDLAAPSLWLPLLAIVSDETVC